MIKTNKLYLIHDNGGRPFKVVIEGKKACILELQDYSGKSVYEPITRKTLGPLEFNFIKEFIGVKGNSILLRIESDKRGLYKYVFIGYEIFRFYTQDQIEKYYSPIGNNDVPYPYAISKENIYLMLEQVILNRKDVLTNDPYNHFYFMNRDIVGSRESSNFKKFRKKTLVKRR